MRLQNKGLWLDAASKQPQLKANYLGYLAVLHGFMESDSGIVFADRSELMQVLGVSSSTLYNYDSFVEGAGWVLVLPRWDNGSSAKEGGQHVRIAKHPSEHPLDVCIRLAAMLPGWCERNFTVDTFRPSAEEWMSIVRQCARHAWENGRARPDHFLEELRRHRFGMTAAVFNDVLKITYDDDSRILEFQNPGTPQTPRIPESRNSNSRILESHLYSDHTEKLDRAEPSARPPAPALAREARAHKEPSGPARPDTSVSDEEKEEREHKAHRRRHLNRLKRHPVIGFLVDIQQGRREKWPAVEQVRYPNSSRLSALQLTELLEPVLLACPVGDEERLEALRDELGLKLVDFAKRSSAKKLSRWEKWAEILARDLTAALVPVSDDDVEPVPAQPTLPTQARHTPQHIPDATPAAAQPTVSSHPRYSPAPEEAPVAKVAPPLPRQAGLLAISLDGVARTLGETVDLEHLTIIHDQAMRWPDDSADWFDRLRSPGGPLAAVTSMADVMAYIEAWTQGDDQPEPPPTGTDGPSVRRDPQAPSTSTAASPTATAPSGPPSEGVRATVVQDTRLTLSKGERHARKVLIGQLYRVYGRGLSKGEERTIEAFVLEARAQSAWPSTGAQMVGVLGGMSEMRHHSRTPLARVLGGLAYRLRMTDELTVWPPREMLPQASAPTANDNAAITVSRSVSGEEVSA